MLADIWAVEVDEAAVEEHHFGGAPARLAPPLVHGDEIERGEREVGGYADYVEHPLCKARGCDPIGEGGGQRAQGAEVVVVGEDAGCRRP